MTSEKEADNCYGPEEDEEPSLASILTSLVLMTVRPVPHCLASSIDEAEELVTQAVNEALVEAWDKGYETGRASIDENGRDFYPYCEAENPYEGD